MNSTSVRPRTVIRQPFRMHRLLSNRRDAPASFYYLDCWRRSLVRQIGLSILIYLSMLQVSKRRLVPGSPCVRLAADPAILYSVFLVALDEFPYAKDGLSHGCNFAGVLATLDSSREKEIDRWILYLFEDLYY